MLLACATLAPSYQLLRAEENPQAASPAATTEERISRDLSYLAADDREGRGVGTDGIWQAGRRSVVLCGIETHVCILQSAFDLLAAGWDVYVVLDAVGSRHAWDHQTAIDRMRQAGAKVVTSEMVMFEWCETSAHPNFRAISQLVKSE